MAVVSSLPPRRVEIPHEPGSWMEIRALSFVALAEARHARLAQLAELGGILSALRDVATPTSAAEADPLASYDRLSLLSAGIVAWSYGPTIAAADLDDPTSEWAAREILAYSVPGPAEVKA